MPPLVVGWLAVVGLRAAVGLPPPRVGWLAAAQGWPACRRLWVGRLAVVGLLAAVGLPPPEGRLALRLYIYIIMNPL